MSDIKVSDSVYQLKQPLGKMLWPEILPYEEGYLAVGEIHKLWYAQFGNPKGVL
jgi:hypothetical protein